MPLPGLIQTVIFKRPTYTADASGGQVPSFSTVYTVDGSLQPARGRTIEQFARRSMQIDHTFYTETAITLKAGDIATDANSVNYVVQAFADQAGQARLFAAYMLKKD